MKPEIAMFQDSFEALAQVALRATGARSFFFIEKGDAAPSDAGMRFTLEYPLPADYAVAFTFLSDAEVLRAKPSLDRMAATMRAICTAVRKDGYAPLVEQLALLEARLMDSKIADRVRGYLSDKTDTDSTEAIARHVETVLRPTRTRFLLEQALSELEEEIEERRLVAQAKGILQARDSVSEEQAHTELRVRSRRSRRPLKDIARQVIENRPVVKGIGA